MIDLVVEEFEQGAWVADLQDTEPFAGTFDLDGETWRGAAVSTRQEDDRHITRIVGGAGALGEVLPDKYYDGNVSLSQVVQHVCSAAGETMGTVQSGVFVTQYQRQRGTAANALEQLAQTLGLMWWIDRAGAVTMQAQRSSGPEAEGVEVASRSNDSVVIVEPRNVRIGGTYEGRIIRHLRWRFEPKRFEVQAYFVPFIFRAPTANPYAQLYSAGVDRQNSDGTLDVIADGRFGVTKVPLLVGVPGSRVEVRPGEVVTLGFFGSDPQKPFCVAHGQDTDADRDVARVDDTVGAGTIQFAFGPGSGAATLAITYTPGDGGAPQVLATGNGTITIGEKITSGSPRLKVGD